MSAGCSVSHRTVMQTAEAQNIVITDNLNTGVEPIHEMSLRFIINISFEVSISNVSVT